MMQIDMSPEIRFIPGIERNHRNYKWKRSGDLYVPDAFAAFPTVAASSVGNSAGNSTLMTLNFPSGSAPGDLIIANINCDSNPTFTWPSGWNALWNSAPAGSQRSECRWRVLDGSEGSSIEVSLGTSQGWAYIAYRIEGHDSSTNPPEAGTPATGNTASPNPPSLTPTGGAKDYLWIVSASWGDGTISLVSYPTNFNDNQVTERWNDADGSGLAMATRNLNAASLDPGTFSISSSFNAVVANTIAVHPGTEGVGGGGGGVVRQMMQHYYGA